ncbi:MAG: DUF4129 domain-containing protein [Thermoplasmatales archaeon]|nr:DUF4129 domain-containing protein [Thermoplasmatales archaeon]
MSVSPRSRPARSTLWIAVLGIALLVGAAAAFLTGPLPSSSSAGAPTFYFAGTIVAWVLAALLIGAVALWTWERWNSGTVPLPTRTIVSILIGILVVIAFVALLRFFGGGPILPLSPTSGGANSTAANQSVTSGPNGTNGTGAGSGGGLFAIAFPYWIFYALAALGLIGAGFAVARAATRSAFAQAARALERPDADPREVLIALYARLLQRIEPVAPGLDASTPEEIRRLHLVPLGVGRESAETITRAFERARYSSHPIDRADVERVRAALTGAIHDLDRPRTLP